MFANSAACVQAMHERHNESLKIVFKTNYGYEEPKIQRNDKKKKPYRLWVVQQANRNGTRRRARVVQSGAEPTEYYALVGHSHDQNEAKTHDRTSSGQFR